jgi:ubiquinone/menaquinone biosynthesis C-methylase UbiE
MDAKRYEGNAEAIEAWNNVLFDKFVRFRDTLATGLGLHGLALLERYPPREGSKVLDLGCGFGDTTIAIARAVGSAGEAVGVDAAPRFIETARHDAEVAGVRNARFLVADVMGDPLGGPYDRVFSRFGTMFFSSPVAALRNARKALASGGTLTVVVWRKKDENPVFHEAEQCVLRFVQPPPETDAVTCGPGPFSQASTDVFSAQLDAAGFDRIAFERFDATIRMGKDVADAIDFALALGPAGEVMRLAGDEAERRKPEVIAALHELLAPWARADGVYGASSTWLVSARAV